MVSIKDDVTAGDYPANIYLYNLMIPIFWKALINVDPAIPILNADDDHSLLDAGTFRDIIVQTGGHPLFIFS